MIYLFSPGASKLLFTMLLILLVFMKLLSNLLWSSLFLVSKKGLDFKLDFCNFCISLNFSASNLELSFTLIFVTLLPALFVTLLLYKLFIMDSLAALAVFSLTVKKWILFPRFFSFLQIYKFWLLKTYLILLSKELQGQNKKMHSSE